MEEAVAMLRWDDDDALMADLGRALDDAAAVPDHRRKAAQAAFAWRSVDEELMRLSFDSLEVGTAAVRGSDDPRLLSFDIEGLALELEVSADAIWGQAVPAQPYEVTIENASGERRTVLADESGIFTIQPLPGPLRFALTSGELTRRTDWILI
ncbi:hypothetical protein GCM10022236_29220 [Microlunatus ginsengisoli]|uniref:Carboxypeptidase regulatory-like domain-containing protein n=2 Tax=Microlunatus ginsengisoli TaxID=363863 RepID=A0ABP7A506_9ACTN